MNLKLSTKQVVFMALLIALSVILTRFLGINIGDFIRIDFAFIALAIMAVYFGPVWAGIGYGIADFIGAILFPKGAYFPGFTLSAIIVGIIYGLFLYNKHFSWWRIIAIKMLVLVLITLGLNCVWLGMLTGKGYMAALAPRIIEGLCMLPIEIMMLGMLQRYLMPHLKKQIVI